MFHVIAVLFVAAFAADGPNCPDRDYSEQMGKVREQGGSQWCHAFVAADLIGFAQGLRPPEQISALDVGIQHLSARKENLANPLTVGADPRSAALLARAAIPAIQVHQDSLLGRPVEERSQAFGTTPSAILAYVSQPGFCLESRMPSEGEGREMKTYIASQLKRMVDPTRIDFSSDEPCPRLRNHPMNSFLSLAEKLNEAALDTVTQNADRACEPRRHAGPVKIAVSTYNFQGFTGDAEEGIASLLKKGVPAGISFNMGFMSKSRARLDHAASVVASHWNGQECEFKIRNSTADCSVLNARYRARCKDGNVWVSSRDLAPRVYNVFGVIKP